MRTIASGCYLGTFLMAWLAVGCSSDDSSTPATGGTGGSGTGAASGTGGSGASGTGGSGTGGSGAGGSVSTDPVKIVPWAAGLTGLMETACTGASDTDSSQWCAFYSAGSSDNNELWVVNVTKVAAGDATCDKSKPENPDCMRLTEDLASTDQVTGISPSFPTSNEFTGRTLLFYSAKTSTATDENFKGSAYAWQPGWTEAKLLAKDTSLCLMAPNEPDKAMCITNLVDTPQFGYDLLAGKIADAPLKVVTTIKDADNAGYVAQGDYFGWNDVPAAGKDSEFWVTKIQDIGDPTKAVKMADGGAIELVNTSTWSYIKPDNSLVFVDFPLGGNERTIASGVDSYLDGTTKFGDGVLWAENVTAGNGTLKYIKDVTKAADASGNVITLVSDADAYLDGVSYSDDLKFVSFSKNPDKAASAVDVWIADTTTGKTCSLETGQTAGGTTLLPGGALVLYENGLDDPNGNQSGVVANPNGCTDKKTFSTSLRAFFVRDDKFVVYRDSDGLFYAQIENGTWPSKTTLACKPTPGQVYGLLANLAGVVYPQEGEDGLYYLALPPS